MASRPPGEDADVQAIVRRVGHDLRNNLSVMRNSVYYLSLKVGQQGGKVGKHLDLLAQEIDTGSRTLRNLMEYLAPKAPQPMAVDLNGLLKELLATDGSGAPTVHLQLAEGMPPAWVDAMQVRTVMENLWAYERTALEPTSSLRVVSRGSGPVVVEWIDNGAGLDATGLERLLSPLDEEGNSSLHLGLAVARRLVLQNGGRWQVESRKELGTRFAVELPGTPEA